MFGCDWIALSVEETNHLFVYDREKDRKHEIPESQHPLKKIDGVKFKNNSLSLCDYESKEVAVYVISKFNQVVLQCRKVVKLHFAEQIPVRLMFWDSGASDSLAVLTDSEVKQFRID